MNPLSHTHERCLTLREIVVPVPGWVVPAVEVAPRFLVYALHATGPRAQASQPSGHGGVLAVLEPFVHGLSREVGEQVLSGLMQIRRRVEERPSLSGHPSAPAYQRTPPRPRPRKGG